VPLCFFELRSLTSSTGPPCSGKSTVCKAIAEKSNFEHFSLGDELRELISPEPTGAAAHIKPTLSTEDIATFTSNVEANTLAPVHLTPKYVKERLFGAGATQVHVRVLIDGFPRDAARWESFKNEVQEFLKPSNDTLCIVLQVTQETARARYKKRGRAGDEFFKRFEEHEKNFEAIKEAMRLNGVKVVESVAGETELLLGELEQLQAATGSASK
jgi:UMP-CMP kinase